MNNEEILYELVKMGEWRITEAGEIWNRKGKRVERRTPQGYFQVRKMVKGIRIHTGAHRLIYRHFKGKIPPGWTINHINGKKADNHPQNLEAVTHSDNLKHAFRLGLMNQDGQKNPNSKLTDVEIEEIRQRYAAGGITQATLAIEYRVTFQTISKVVRGASHKNLPGKTADYSSRRTGLFKKRNRKGQYTS